jgi:hypothetical protein
MRRSRRNTAVLILLAALAPAAAGAGPESAESRRDRRDVQLRKALDSLAVMNGVSRDRFRVDPAALDFARSVAGEFKLQRYLVREPLRIPGTVSAAGDALVGGIGLHDRIALLADLTRGEEPLAPRAPEMDPAEVRRILDAPQPLLEALTAVFAGTGKRFQGNDRDEASRQIRTLSRPLQTDVASLLLAVLEAAKTRDRVVEESDLDRGGVFEAKSRKTADRLRNYLLQWDSPDPTFDPELQKVWAALPTVDLGNLYRGGADLARGIDAAGGALTAEAPGVEPGRPTEFEFTWKTPLGAVSVGGTGANTYDGDRALVVDLGGDDRYAGPGGVSGQAPVSVVVDLGGDDTYAAADSGRAGPGGAILGYAGVVDLGTGRDAYRGVSWSSGFAFLGVGWIEDGGGDDVYETQWLGQGAALFGLALVLDAGGDDVYTIAAADSSFPAGRSQGFGGPGGVGAIVDLAGGDTYTLDDAVYHGEGVARYVGFQQGTAGGFRDLNAGGIGLLVDALGNDDYRAKEWAQGTGMDAGVGALIDGGGNDRYDAWLWAQGCGGSRGVGVILETDGNDQYTVRGGRGLGIGYDLGTGMLVDDGGGDHYALRGMGFGSSQDQGAGFFFELGGEDSYGPDIPGLAQVLASPGSPWRATVPGVALFVDLEQYKRPGYAGAPVSSEWFPAGGNGPQLGGGVLGAVSLFGKPHADGDADGESP